MSDKHEQLWHAYLDGELSVTEMADFEKSLTPEDRERLAAEMKFENGLAERLSENAACPDEVWQRTRAMLEQAHAGSDKMPENVVSLEAASSRRPWFWGVVTTAAAACVAFAILYAPGTVSDEGTQVVILAAESIDELKELSEIEGDAKQVDAYLADHGMSLKLNDPKSIGIAAVHWGIEIVGARDTSIGGEPVVELLMGCCDYPVKVVMARRDSAAARYIGQASGRDFAQVQATRIVHEDYLAAVVGTHPAHGLLDIFAGQHP